MRRSKAHGRRERLNIKPGKTVKERRAAALAKLKANKEEQEKKKLAA